MSGGVQNVSEFRKPVEQPTASEAPKEAPVDSRSTSSVEVPELLATYSEDQGKPYVAKYLDIENVWDQDSTLKHEVETIEGYIKDQISKGNLDNSVLAGDKFLKEMEKKAQISPYETSINKITKLLAYIEFRRVVES